MKGDYQLFVPAALKNQLTFKLYYCDKFRLHSYEEVMEEDLSDMAHGTAGSRYFV